MGAEEDIPADRFEATNGTKHSERDLGNGTSFSMVTITRVTEVHHCDCESRRAEDADSMRKAFGSEFSGGQRSSIDITDTGG